MPERDPRTGRFIRRKKTSGRSRGPGRGSGGKMTDSTLKGREGTKKGTPRPGRGDKKKVDRTKSTSKPKPPKQKRRNPAQEHRDAVQWRLKRSQYKRFTGNPRRRT